MATPTNGDKGFGESSGISRTRTSCRNRTRLAAVLAGIVQLGPRRKAPSGYIPVPAAYPIRTQAFPSYSQLETEPRQLYRISGIEEGNQ